MDSEKDVENKLGPGETGVYLRPMVYVPEGRVAAYYAVPIMRAADGQIVKDQDFIGRGVDETRLDPEALTATLRRFLPRALAKAHEISLIEEGVPVIIPVNAMALDMPSVAGEFTAFCRQTDARTQAAVVFEVTHFPKTTTLETVDDIAILLYPFCGHYLARPPFGLLDFKMFSNTNFKGVALDLRDRPWPLDKAEPILRKFHAAADRYRLSVYLHGAGSAQIYEIAESCPYDFVDGSGVAVPA